MGPDVLPSRNENGGRATFLVVKPPTVVPRRRRWRRWLSFAAAMLLVWWTAGFAAAQAITWPWNTEIPPRRELMGQAIEEVAVSAGDGTTVRGWLVAAGPRPSRCVVLAAGIRGSRLAMLARAEWYLAQGWSVLVADLRGTGASEGVRVTMGWNEALDLAACRGLLRRRGFTTVGAHGVSLGAAAIVYTAMRDPADQWDFAVLEACYRDVASALHARLPWMPFPALALWPLAQSAAWLTGVDGELLRPIAAVPRLATPTLFVCGTEDREVGERAAADLLAASGAADKELFEIPGVAHVDLWPVGGDGLRRALAAFLARR